MRTVGAAIAVALLAGGLVLMGPAAPAAADEAVFHDRYNDLVVTGSSCDDCPPATPVPLPYSPFLLRLDIKKLTVDYNPFVLRLSLSARAFEVNHLPEVVYARFRVRGADGQKWVVFVEDPFGAPVKVTLSKQGQPQPCDGLAGGIDQATAEWAAVVPAGCIGAPRWVRAGGQLAHIEHTSFTYVVDDALTSEASHTTLRPRLSRKVHRS